MPAILSDMTDSDCRRLLRNIELKAYSYMVSALRAQGELTKQRRKLLEELQIVLGISIERHKAEVRRAVNDEKINTVVNHLYGPNSEFAWIMEGRRLVPVLPRTTPQTIHTQLATRVANWAAVQNLKLPSPYAPYRREIIKNDEPLEAPEVPVLAEETENLKSENEREDEEKNEEESVEEDNTKSRESRTNSEERRIESRLEPEDSTNLDFTPQVRKRSMSDTTYPHTKAICLGVSSASEVNPSRDSSSSMSGSTEENELQNQNMFQVKDDGDQPRTHSCSNIQSQNQPSHQPQQNSSQGGSWQPTIRSVSANGSYSSVQPVSKYSSAAQVVKLGGAQSAVNVKPDTVIPSGNVKIISGAQSITPPLSTASKVFPKASFTTNTGLPVFVMTSTPSGLTVVNKTVSTGSSLIPKQGTAVTTTTVTKPNNNAARYVTLRRPGSQTQPGKAPTNVILLKNSSATAITLPQGIKLTKGTLPGASVLPSTTLPPLQLQSSQSSAQGSNLLVLDLSTTETPPTQPVLTDILHASGILDSNQGTTAESTNTTSTTVNDTRTSMNVQLGDGQVVTIDEAVDLFTKVEGPQSGLNLSTLFFSGEEGTQRRTTTPTVNNEDSNEREESEET